MNTSEFNRAIYEETWRTINLELNKANSLSDALLMMEEQQLDVGFIQDDLRSVTRFRLHHHPHDKNRIFIIQYNPKRALRQAGAGRRELPPGCRSINNNCFLCRDNVYWQQRGIQLGYDIHINETDYIAWRNPFPLMPTHATIATKDHIPQSWVVSQEEESIIRFQSILKDLIQLTAKLKGYFGFYNGIGAGATIPEHFHFQFFRRSRGLGMFPLEIAADKQRHEEEGKPIVTIVNNYPIIVIYFFGESNFIIDNAVKWMRSILNSEFKEELSANMICTTAIGNHDKFHLYIIPRNRFYSHAPGMVGMIGGLEVLGELVFSSEIEKQQLDTGHVNYQFVEQILAAVEPVGLISLIEKNNIFQ